MNALVTGANGFIGSHLVDRLLALGHTVRAFVRPGARLQWLTSPRVELFYGSLTDPADLAEALDGIDWVFHVAGTVVARDWRGFYQANVRPARALLKAIREHARRIERFVLVSSTGASGPSPDGHLLREHEFPAPVGDYGRSKLIAERITASFADAVPVTIVRPCAVYGPRDRNFLIMFRHVQSGLIPVLGSREQIISLIHVEELVDGIVRAAESVRARGEVYFLAGERPHTRSEILETAERVAATRARRLVIPDRALSAFLAIQTVAGRVFPRASLLSPERLATLSHPCWAFDGSKAREHLGFRTKIDLEDGLTNTFAWYCAQGWLTPAR